MYIEDEELRTLYRDTSQEHIATLEAGFLHLEKNPDDLAKVTELMRATHSLKGDSRMLGVQDAEKLTHQLEDLLSSIEQGQRDITPGLCDCFYQGLDAIRKIAHEAFTGEPSNVSVFHELAQLMNAGEALAPADSLTDAPELELEPVDQASIEAEITETDYGDELTDPMLTLPSIEELELRLSEAIQATPEVTSLEEMLLSEEIANSPEVTSLEEMLLSKETATPNTTELLKNLSPPPSLEAPPSKTPSLESLSKEGLSSEGPSNESSSNEGPSKEGPSKEGYQINTVRVAATKLDTLMTQAGELAVTKRRITRRMDDIDRVLLFWEEWMRDSLVNRLSVSEPPSQAAETTRSLSKFQEITEDRLDQLGDLLKQLRTTAYEDSARLETLSNNLESGILKLRQLPLSTMFSLFPRMVRDLAKQQGKDINLVIEGGETQADKRILEEMKAPLTHLIRNAVDHGIEAPSERVAMGKSPTATIWLKAYQRGSYLEIEVVDDGRGLSVENIKRTAKRRGLYTEAALNKMTVGQLQELIFMPGFSTRTNVTEISGRGVGLDVVRVNVEHLKGSIQVKSNPAKGASFRFTLNTSLATASALLVAIDHTPYAIPVEFVEVMMRVDRQHIFTLEGSPTINFRDQPLSVIWLKDLLDMPVSVAASPQPITDAHKQSIPCVVIKVGSERLGVFVDELIDQQDIVLKPHSKLLKRIQNIAGATILGTGEVCMVLSPQDLIRSVGGKALEPIDVDWTPTITKRKVLLVEDSVPIRTQVRRILEGAGYQVTTAVDGLDGLEKLQQGDMFDAVISDVEMPNLDGLGMTTRIRKEAQYQDLPIILVTTLAGDDDKRRGADAGANAYLTKGDFDQSLLINTLRSLI